MRAMDDARVGAAFRAVRIRRGWRQQDVADKCRVSRTQISLIERGHIARVTIEALREVAAVLDIRIDVVARWRGGELDRLLNARHSALGDTVARWLRRLGWEVAPEVSFAISGERGWIDLLAWHAPTRTVLVIELKTEIVDLQELLGVVDRKTRLAARIGRDRGWNAAIVATWVVVAEGPTNRRRVAAHQALLRTALPDDGRTMRRWLRSPSGRVAALSFFSYDRGGNARSALSGPKRVRRPAAAAS
jgi:transcriptional regulator with XRE-family HTH domain